MSEEPRRGERWSTIDVSRVVWLADEGFLPDALCIDGVGTGRRVVAIYQNSRELQAALDRWFETDNHCRVFLERYRDALFAFRDALRTGSTERIDLVPTRQPTGGTQR